MPGRVMSKASTTTGLLLTTVVVGAMILTACAPTQFAAFNAGKNFQGAQKFSEAVDKYNAFISHNQDSTLVPYALYYIGQCYIGLDKKADALTALEKVKEQYPASDPARWAELAIQRLQGSAGGSE